MNRLLKIIFTTAAVFLAGYYVVAHHSISKEVHLECLGTNFDKDGREIGFVGEKRTIYLRVIKYRWWMTLFKQSKGEVWEGGPRNIMRIIFFEESWGTVQFRSEDGIVEGYLDGLSKKFALKKGDYTLRGGCQKITEPLF